MQTLHFDKQALELLSGAPAARARTEKPRLRVVSFGHYEAQSSDGKRWYSITCDSATKEMVCGCPARKPCKHLAAILPVHIHLAKERAAQAAPAPAPVRYCGCGLPAAGLSSYCQEHANEQAGAYADILADMAG